MPKKKASFDPQRSVVGHRQLLIGEIGGRKVASDPIAVERVDV
jgi:hypothetical protein